MFETHESQGYSPCTGIGSEDSQLWHMVELGLERPWLFVVFTYNKQPGPQIKNNVFLSGYKQLVSLAKDFDIIYESIMLASPGYKSSSGSWRFDEINEIWVGDESEPEYGKTGEVYVLKDGLRLTHSFYKDEETLLNLQRVYPPQ